MHIKRIVITTIMLLALMSSGVLGASQAVSVGMTDYVKADVAFTGVCTGAETYLMAHPKLAGSLVVTRYKFSIPGDGVLTGNVSKDFSFTQWGAPRKECRKLGLPYFMGIPFYEVGKEYTVFLTSETELGLRSTIGLGYGKFDVIPVAGGGRVLVNDYGNKYLFKGIVDKPIVTKSLGVSGAKSIETRGGPVDYNSFIEIFKDVQKKAK
jgi:hypothetical protein